MLNPWIIFSFNFCYAGRHKTNKKFRIKKSGGGYTTDAAALGERAVKGHGRTSASAGGPSGGRQAQASDDQAPVRAALLAEALVGGRAKCTCKPKPRRKKIN